MKMTAIAGASTVGRNILSMEPPGLEPTGSARDSATLSMHQDAECSTGSVADVNHVVDPGDAMPHSRHEKRSNPDTECGDGSEINACATHP